LYILAMAIFFYGYAVARFQVPPAAFLEARVQDIQSFIAGDALDRDTSLVQKIQSDLGLVPARFFGHRPSGLLNRYPHTSVRISGLNSRRAPPEMYIGDEGGDGYRVIIGAVDFEASFWGAILINPEGEVVHSWQLSTEYLPGNRKPDHHKVLYGTHVGRDGSIIFSMQEPAGGIVKVDACSEEVWNLAGSYHHTVSADGKGAFWTFTGTQSSFDQDMAKVSIQTGEILQTIDMTEVRERNDHAFIWNMRDPLHADWQELTGAGHMTHGNDIDPLRAELAPHFKDFEEGDLLISYASTNLVFVLDPDTLEVKWWRVGTADYQHDPDWEPDGRISIFNNKNRHDQGRGYSEIVAIDPATYRSEVIYGNEAPHFKSMYNGRQERTGFGTRMITSANQGWAFEVDAAGRIVFSFLNIYDDKQTLFLSNALHVPTDYFDGAFWEACDSRVISSKGQND